MKDFNFHISLDKFGFNSKPPDAEVKRISNRIANNSQYVNQDNIKEILEAITIKGCSFTPAIFKNGTKTQMNVEEMRLFVLDLDETITYEDFKARARKYDLPLFFSYETFNSKNCNRFRVAFLHDVPVFNKKIVNIILSALMTIFPETDSTSSDISKMYFGSNKGLLEFNDNVPAINIHCLIRNMELYLKQVYGAKHYKEKIRAFSKRTNLALNSDGFLDVSLSDVNEIGNDYHQDYGKIDVGGNSAMSIISIIEDAENPQQLYYRNKDTNDSSDREGEGTSPHMAKILPSKKNNEYRSSAIPHLRFRCQLFRDFENGEIRLHHHELFSLATNLTNIETGAALFMKTLKKNSHHICYDEKYDYWEHQLNTIKHYKPASCDGFCPYKDTCYHGTNMLLTARPKYHTAQIIDEHREQLCDVDDIVSDLSRDLNSAYKANDTRLHFLKYPIGSGKSSIVRKFMKDNPNLRVIVAYPNNDLKNEQYRLALSEGINAIVTPSLRESKDKLPKAVWQRIEGLYDTGHPHAVTNYIKEVITEGKIDKSAIAILKQYLKEMEMFYRVDCVNVFTTHNRFRTLDYHILKKYDAVIIDEDPIMNCMLINQVELRFTALNKILDEIGSDNTLDPTGKLAKKIRSAAEATETKSLFKLPVIPYEKSYDAISTSVNVNIAPFCVAEYFYFKKKSDEDMLSENSQSEDSIVFFKPFKLNHKIKHIILSATIERNIANYCFGSSRVKFYECRKIKNRGTLYQYDELTMSRAFIDANRDVLQEIIKFSGFESVIGHKKYNLNKLHYGKALGEDNLKGENLTVLGTPNPPPHLVKLLAYTIGFGNNGFDENAAMTYQQVVHDGFKFWFMTFDDKNAILRKIQFYLIASELQQAIGRARLSRTKATVKLFSNYPIQGAIQQRLPQAILDKYKDKDKQRKEKE